MSTDKQKFVEKLRVETNYPFFRRFVDICYRVVRWFLIGGIALAIPNVIILIIITKSGGKESNDASLVLLISIPFLIACLFFWRITYEMTILAIDLADGTLHSAYVNHATYLLASKRSKDA